MNTELIIPIYIDTNTLLDLLASIEGGFSLVEKVTSQVTLGKAAESSAQGEGGTEFGIPNVLSLLKIRLSGVASTRSSQERHTETQTERFHTYGSLLTRLRAYLIDNGLIHKSSDKLDEWWDQIHPSTFVEIRGVFRPNPLADGLRSMEKVALLSSSMAGLAHQPSRSVPRQQGSRHQRYPQDQLAPVRKMAQDMLSDLERENVRLFVVDLNQAPNYRAVTLLQLEYLRDQSMTELSHKEFTLLGKVVRKLDHDSEETVKLLRGTGLGSFGKNTLNQFIEAFSNMGDMEFPEIQIEVPSPALEIVPIAIFV